MMWFIILMIALAGAGVWYFSYNPARRKKVQEDLSKTWKKAKDETKKL